MLLSLKNLQIIRLQIVCLCKRHSFSPSKVLHSNQYLSFLGGGKEGEHCLLEGVETKLAVLRCWLCWLCKQRTRLKCERCGYLLQQSGAIRPLSGYLLGLSVSKNLNLSQICFVILTLALATFNFSLVSGSFFVILFWEGQDVSERAKGLTPNKTRCTLIKTVGAGRCVCGYLITKGWQICFSACVL